VDFSTGSQKHFSGWARSGEIAFYPLEINKTTFFVNSLIGRRQISKSRGAKSPSDAYDSEYMESKLTWQKI